MRKAWLGRVPAHVSAATQLFEMHNVWWSQKQVYIIIVGNHGQTQAKGDITSIRC